MKIFLISIFLSLFIFNGEPNNLPSFFTNNYAFVPSGTLLDENTNITINQFYIFKTEISNIQYLEFVASVGDKDKYSLHPFEENGMIYDPNNPIHADDPVRNISFDVAEDYCKWLEKMLSKSLQIDPDDIEVRLPSKHEWIYAGKGGNSNNVYSWNGIYLRDSEGKFLANFDRNISQESITFDAKSNSYVVLPTQNFMAKIPHNVQSMHKNDYGLYHMSGNVAEMTQSGLAMGGSYLSPGYDIRLMSYIEYTEKNPAIGFRPIVIIEK